MKPRAFLALSFVLASQAPGIGAGTPTRAEADRYRPEGRYDARVPTPASALGFDLGERPARHEAVVRYAEALATTSPRIRLERYARSHEGRELLLLVVSSERNLARLDSVRADLHALADPRRPLGSAATEALLRRTPAIAYLAYAIHGDELSSADAALRLAYELAAGETDDVRAILDQAVVLIDPIENPDGRERILSMIASYQGSVPNPDPDALSHAGFWPWGRANHYLFDLNRDWFALVHPESRGRASILRNWRPQLVVDSHEMGFESTYLFSPPRDPFNPNLPSTTRPWWERFAADQAKAFDRRGWSYYTREWNEEFFPGYGSALALYQGAVGILYEQASTDGQPIRKPSGRIERYEESVARQFTSSLANLTTVATHRRELLLAYRAARAEAVERGRRGVPRAFYFAPAPDRDRAERLAHRLAMLGIEVERLEKLTPIPGARALWDGRARAGSLPAGSFRVRLDQPDGLLARAVLEPHTPMPDSSLAEEREHLERQKGTRLYDVTAWSPLLASGLDSWWSAGVEGGVWSRVDPESEPSWSRGGVDAGAAGYGWIFDGAPDAAPVLAARLVERGLTVRAGEKPFRLDGRAYPRGSFLVRAEENPPAAAESLASLASQSGIMVVPAATARIAEGPDLGGDHWILLKPARTAILAGPGLDFTSVGAAWHLLDRDWGLRVSLLDPARVASAELARYNVIVLPHAWERSSAYRRALGAGGLEALRTWIEAGGTLVAVAGGAEFVADSAARLSAARPRPQMLKDFPGPRLGLDAAAIRAAERFQAMGLEVDGSPVASAGLYAEMDRAAVLGVPGPGSPLLGPGARALLGAPRGAPSAAGSAGRRTAGPARAAAGRSGAAAPGGATETPKTGTSMSEAEQEQARTRADERLRRFLPSGAILRVDLDAEHWLAYGCGDRMAVMARGHEALLARDPVTTVGRYAPPASLHLGGLLWPEAAGRLGQTAYLTREVKGRGQVVLFAGDPNFRGYFWGTQRAFLNAVLLGPGLGTAATIPW